MYAYLVRRVLISVTTLVVITFIIFGLIRNMPGTPLTINLAESDPSRQISPADLKRLERAYGLDKPWPQAYVQWIGNVVQGDLGRSFVRKRPVAWIIGEHIGPTLILSVSSLILTYIIAIPLGLSGTARAGHLDERITGTVLYVLYSFPSFVAALLLQIWLAVRLGWLPLYGMTTSEIYDQLSTWGKVKDIAAHAAMPIAVYTYGSLAYYTRFIRANMQEVIRQDYIRTARAKGVGPLRVLWHHAFRNTLIPLVTLIGLTFPTLLSGAVIIERIFQWPGMGQLFFLSLDARDYPTIMGLTLIFAVMTLAGQLIADVLYAVVDPRVRLS